MIVDLAILTFPVAIGLPLAWRAGLAVSRAGCLGFGFLLGVVIWTVVLTLAGLFGISYSVQALAIMLGGCAALAWAIGLRGGARVPPPIVPQPFVVRLVLAFIAFNLVAVAIFSTRLDPSVWDVIYVWLPKARALAESRPLKTLASGVYPDYPPLWPLQLFVSSANAPHYARLKLLPIVYFGAALAIIFDALRDRVRPHLLALTLLIVLGIPYLWYWYGLYDLMSEVPFLAFATSSTIVAVSSAGTRNLRAAVCAGLLAGGALLTRLEGFEHAVILGVLLAWHFLRAGRRGAAILVLAIPVAFYAGWHAVVSTVFHAPPTYPIRAGAFLSAITLAPVWRTIRYAITELANPFVFGPTLIAIAVGIMATLEHRRRDAVLYLLIFGANVAAMTATYLIMPSTNGESVTWWLSTGFKRMLLHFVPILYLFLAFALTHSGTDNAERSAITRPLRRWSYAPVLLLLAIWTGRAVLPEDIALRDLSPHSTIGLHSPASYAGDPGLWWSSPNTDAFMAAPALNQRARVTFDLLNLGWRGGHESAWGRFVTVTATVGLVQTNVGSVQFSIMADGRTIAGPTTTVVGDTVRIPLRGSIPAWAHEVILVADAMGDNNSDNAVWFDAKLRRQSWFELLPAVCLLAAGVMIAFGRSIRWRFASSHELTPWTLMALAILLQLVDVWSCRTLSLWL